MMTENEKEAIIATQYLDQLKASLLRMMLSTSKPLREHWFPGIMSGDTDTMREMALACPGLLCGAATLGLLEAMLSDLDATKEEEAS